MSKPKFEDFDGSTDIEVWVRNFKLMVDLSAPFWTKDVERESEKKVVNVKAGNQIRLSLKKSFADWVDTLPPEKFVDYNDVLLELQKHVLGVDFQQNRKQKALELKRADCDNLAEYYSKKISFLKKAFGGEEDKSMVTDMFVMEMYLSGFDEEMRAKILVNPEKERDSITKLHDLAVRLEAVETAKNKADSINSTVEKFGDYRGRGNRFRGRGDGRRGRRSWRYIERGRGHSDKHKENDEKKTNEVDEYTNIICYGCGGYGHMKIECPTANRKKKDF